MKGILRILSSIRVNCYALIAKNYLSKIEAKYANYIIIVATAGLGDICYALSYLDALKRKHNKRVLVVTSSYSKELLSFYPAVDECYFLSKRQTSFFKQLSRSIFGSVCFNSEKTVYTCDAWVFWPWSIIDLPKINFFNIINYSYFGLDGAGEIQYPVVPGCDLSRFGFSDLRKTIIINPHSNYLNADSDIFHQIVDVLSSKGYDLFTNVSSSFSATLPNTRPLLCSLQELYHIIKNARCFISVRSGILDFSINCGGIFLVIYNHKADQRFRKIYGLDAWCSVSKVSEFASDEEARIMEYVQNI